MWRDGLNVKMQVIDYIYASFAISGAMVESVGHPWLTRDFHTESFTANGPMACMAESRAV